MPGETNETPTFYPDSQANVIPGWGSTGLATSARKGDSSLKRGLSLLLQPANFDYEQLFVPTTPSGAGVCT